MSFRMWHDTRGFLSSFSVKHRPPHEVGRAGRDPLSNKAGESTLMSRSGGEKGLRLCGARKLSVPLEIDWYVGELCELHQGCQVPF